MEFQHFHPYYEIHILLDELAYHIIEGTRYRLKMFDIVCLRPALLHKTEYPQGSPVRRLVIRFQIPAENTGMDSELNAVFSLFWEKIPIYRFDRELQKEIFNCLNELFLFSTEYRTDNESAANIRTLVIYNHFLEFLTTIYLKKNHSHYIPDSFDTSSSKIYTITTYIHSHYDEKLSLETLAREFFMSPYYLSHLFKSVTGFTLTNYIQMTRVSNAQRLLLFSNHKITDIAENCGFNSFSQFNRVFNKFCQMSPRVYKAMVAAGNIPPDSVVPTLINE